MTPQSPVESHDLSAPAPDARLPYEAPQLIDRGDVAETTQSGPGGNPSVDGTYS